jgi:hypothetical protein
MQFFPNYLITMTAHIAYGEKTAPEKNETKKITSTMKKH